MKCNQIQSKVCKSNETKKINKKKTKTNNFGARGIKQKWFEKQTINTVLTTKKKTTTKYAIGYKTKQRKKQPKANSNATKTK